MWFRRDLRATDNAALYRALKAATDVIASGGEVHCVFIFDETILRHLPRQDRRVCFIWDSLIELQANLQRLGGSLHVVHGDPLIEIPRLAAQFQAAAVHTNHDDEPQALLRDEAVRDVLRQYGTLLHTYKDHVIFERNEVLSQQGKPYTVFTPYKNMWLKTLDAYQTKPYPVAEYAAALGNTTCALWPSLANMGFDDTYRMPTAAGESGAQALLAEFLPRMGRYDTARNLPAVRGVSYLSVHLRFGTVSIRQLVAEALRLKDDPAHAAGATTWLSELIWRDFYHQIMHHRPAAMRAAFKPEYDRIQWEQGAPADARFEAWCEGRTGYPLVDAAQRQLKQTGYMHNRLRMVSACFLIKDLGIDWRRGEAYFATHLNDFDLAANNGGWQWASSSGCDSQPYFRIFNPITQSEKFDAQGKFIRKYVPELAKLSDKDIHAPWLAPGMVLQAAGVSLGENYAKPIVDHATARAATLARYAVVKVGAAA